MAHTKFGKGYGQIELNNVFFRREGAIEAQCALDTNDFAFEGEANESKGYCENGMILAVDKTNNLVKLPTDAANEVYALVYSTEHMYDERKNSLGDFYLPAGTFYPRLGYIKKGEVFTTNCVCYEETDFPTTETETTVEAVIKKAIEANEVYGVPSVHGRIHLTKDAKDSSLVLKAVKYYTMPNGTPGIKFQVMRSV